MLPVVIEGVVEHSCSEGAGVRGRVTPPLRQ